MTRPGLEADLIAEAWAALTFEASDIPPRPLPPDGLRVTGTSGALPSHFAAEEVAVASVGVALLGAAALGEQCGSPAASAQVDRGHVFDSVRSERFFRVGGRPAGVSFAPLSRFWRAADGWVRTHANYPWHHAALLRALQVSDDAVDVAAAITRLSAEEIERTVFAAGGIAAAIRDSDAWLAHPQGRALATEPLIGHRRIGDGPARPRPPAPLPAGGVRVLDLTRVIAGPVCTRLLGALGADVLRVDPPGYPDMPTGVVADSLLGKRTSFLDLETTDGAATLHARLDRADVVVCGYRPGALDRFGLDEETLAERHPGLVAVYIDAWGHSGPWAERRGFDSVVQGPTGIAMGESQTGDEPGVLPCQLLDHGTGYLAAAAALDGLRRQGETGGTHVRRLSLARTAMWLSAPGTHAPDALGANTVDAGAPPWRVALDSASGPVTVVAPPGALDDQPLRWPFPLAGYGSDPPTWPGA